MNIFNEIETVVINLERRHDRLDKFREQAQRLHIPHYTYVGIDDRENPNRGFSESYLQVLALFSAENVLILEDDVFFTLDVEKRFDALNIRIA